MSATPATNVTPLRLYLKIFFWTSIPFGVFMGARFGVGDPDRSLSRIVTLGALVGAGFGAMMSFILGTLAFRSARKLGPGVLAVHQFRAVQVRGDRADVLRRVAEAVSAFPRVRSVRTDAVSGRVEARTGWSWKSFGENITARLEQLSPEIHCVIVESRPRLSTTLVDYGVNAENADAIMKSLA